MLKYKFDRSVEKMSIFIIKIIACITMVLDHVKYAIPETRCFVTQYFGRIAFPLFAFLIGEGYCYTRDLQKYYERLITFALISQIPFMFFRAFVGEWLMLNVMFTLLLGLLAINIFDKLKKKYYISLPLIVMIAYLASVLNVDYGWYGVMAVFVLYVFRYNNGARIFAFAILNLLFYFERLFAQFSVQSLISYIFATIPAFLLVLYNGKLGPKTKYIYYIFYPVHMMIFGIICLL